MRSPWTATKTLVTATLLATFVVHTGWVQASSNAEFASEAVKRKKNPKPKQDKSAGETTQERDRRMMRECKGRPNAGACEGFAS